MRVPFSDLVPGESSDKWHNLMPVNATTKGDPPSLRVNVKFRHEVIMPLPEYNSLKEVRALAKLQNNTDWNFESWQVV